jgi:signal transduction histidine kinase/HD-like signal output (HDOD) protein
MKMDAKKIIDSVRLPTLSKTLLEIIEVEKQDSITFLDDIKKIVEKDPLLSAHILKVANSSFYGFSQKIRTVSHAIGLLGVRKIKSLAFSFSIFDFLKNLDYKAIYGETFNLILKKTLLISACAAILSRKTDHLNREELYLSGLLAEIGELILFLYSPDKYCRIYSVQDKNVIPKEKETFQTDHITVGIEFCDQFKLPGFIKTAIKNHFQLQEGEEPSKISFIANRIAELLLTQNEEERSAIFKELENYTKKLLHLSLWEIEESIRQLPDIMEAFVSDFPEMQKDLKKIIRTSSSLIISLMKKEMEMIAVTRELTDSQKKLAREKIFLSHMLNLSYFFSSLMAPLKIISSLFEYFENFIHEFTLQFIYHRPENSDYILFKSKADIDDHSRSAPIDIDKYASLVKAKISNETVRLEKNEMELMGKDPAMISLVFPISFHHYFFGFLILDVEKQNYLELDLEMTYVQILSNIIANSFQNYLSFEGLQNETNKKKLVTRELLKFDEELNQSRATVIELQKTGIMGDLLPVIFHKLKNKLTPILGYAQIILAKVQDSTTRERIKKIEKNANELANQLNVLRDYFKNEKVSKEKENLNHIIVRLKPYFDELERNHDIKIKLDTDYAVPDDLLNPGQIEALISNLVDNAVSAVKEKGENKGIVTIKTECMPGGYRLIVRDNGIGIKKEDLHQIWTPFYTTYPNHPGIGLAICEKILVNHGAAYTVRSQEGQFTEFECTFERTLAAKKEPPAAVLKPRRHDVGGKILIVDDEAYLLDLMKEILLNEGNFDIVTTTSGKEAIRLIDDNFDLVISDIRMPEVDGMDIYDFLKSKGIESRLIMVTADPSSEDVTYFLKKNRVECLNKPFELMKFKQIVLEKLSS